MTPKSPGSSGHCERLAMPLLTKSYKVYYSSNNISWIHSTAYVHNFLISNKHDSVCSQFTCDITTITPQTAQATFPATQATYEFSLIYMCVAII